MMHLSLGEMRCPTCGARQAPAGECRRCKCDLSLYRSALDRCAKLRLETLCRLRDGRFAAAVEAARVAWSLSPDEDTARLLAVSNLLAGRFDDAVGACLALRD